MSASKHTPGPWQVMADPSYPIGLHPLHHHRFIATKTMGVDLERRDFDGKGTLICALRDQENQKADAHLIAAAPELLAICDKILGFPKPFGAITIDIETVRELREVANKAKGGESR